VLEAAPDVLLLALRRLDGRDQALHLAARGHRLREVGDPAFRTAEVGLERPADLGGAGRPMFIPSGEVADHLLEARRGEDVLLEYRDNHVMQTFHGDHPPVGTHGRATATAGPAGIV